MRKCRADLSAIEGLLRAVWQVSPGVSQLEGGGKLTTLRLFLNTLKPY